MRGRTASRAQPLNAHCERFVPSAKFECLGKIVPLGEQHLRTALSEFIRYYHAERPHQGLGNRLIEPALEEAGRAGPVKCRERLGGTLRFYYREAA